MTQPTEAKTEEPKKNGPAPTEPTAAIVPVDHDEPSRAIGVFSSERAFQAALRMANAIASSSLVPEAYRGRDNIPNVLLAMEMANRIGASVFMVMQNLDVIHGRPSWRAQFLIATVNSTGRFTPLRYRWEGKQGTDEWGCRAYAKDAKTGEECVGSLITIATAKAEGWYGKNGSKWKTIPEQMLCYRAASFWTRAYAPEVAIGMQTTEEVIDTTGVVVGDVPAALAPGDRKSLEAELLKTPAPAGTPKHDPKTGEVHEEPRRAREPGSDDV